MYFAGIDAHATYLTVRIVNKSGEEVGRDTVRTHTPTRLLEVLAPFRPLAVVVETSPFWPWIHDLLAGQSITFHLAHARELRAIAHAAQKNDQVDALLLARMLAARLIPAAYARPAHQRDLQRLLRHRTFLVRYRTALCNRIHTQLHQSGLHLPREQLLRRKTRPWLRHVAWPHLHPEQRRLVRTHLQLIDQLAPLLRVLDRRIRHRGADVPEACLLQTVPGIGPYWGLLLAVELTPIERFAGPPNLVSYAGLAPTTRSSGGHTRHGSLPAAANRWVRWALISAVSKHILHAPDSPLSLYYARLKDRLGWKKARVATARKLARIVFAMLRTGQAWRPGTHT